MTEEKKEKEVIAFIKTAPIYELLEIGKRLCPTNFAVKYYYNKKHPEFYKNRVLLEKAIRKVWANDGFKHREFIESSIKLHYALREK